MKSNIEKAYYNKYTEGSGETSETGTPIDMTELLMVAGDKGEEIKDLRESKDQFNILVVGCATPKNIDLIDDLLEKTKPEKEDGKEHIIILDRSDIALDNIKESTKDRKEGVKVSVLKMDMNEMGLADKSADIVLSDYTINFNSNVERMGDFFKEISRVLDSDGQAYLSIFTQETGLNSRVKHHRIDDTGGYMFYPTFDKVTQLAEENKLKIEMVRHEEHDLGGSHYPPCYTQSFLKLTKKPN